MLLFAIIESIYIYYVYNIFKTKYSFHHPIEVLLQKNPMMIILNILFILENMKVKYVLLVNLYLNY